MKWTIIPCKNSERQGTSMIDLHLDRIPKDFAKGSRISNMGQACWNTSPEVREQSELIWIRMGKRCRMEMDFLDADSFCIFMCLLILLFLFGLDMSGHWRCGEKPQSFGFPHQDWEHQAPEIVVSAAPRDHREAQSSEEPWWTNAKLRWTQTTLVEAC